MIPRCGCGEPSTSRSLVIAKPEPSAICCMPTRRRLRYPRQEWVGLVKSIAAGDQRALHALYARTHRIVFTLIVRITNNRETAEELTLDVFHDVWRRASTYDAAGGSVLGWIMNQARSRAIDRLRFHQRKKRVNKDADDPLPMPLTNDPREAFDLREQVASCETP